MLLFLFIYLTFFKISLSCPPGTVESFTDKTVCYLFQRVKKAYLNAEEICVQNNGHLTSVQNMFDNVFISQQAKQNFNDSVSDNFWIGANRLLIPGIWGWIDGSPFTFMDWDKGQPQNISGADCGAVTAQGGNWIADDCYDEKSFVCQIEIATTTKPPPKQNCPNNWSYYEKTGYCYYVGINATWEKADDICFSQGGHLASIHSIDENNFVTNLLPFDPNDHKCDDTQGAWIGLYTVTNQTSWRWTDNTPYNFSVWAPGRPAYPFLLEYCAAIWNGPPCDAPLETWTSGRCDENSKFYVCKKVATA